MPRTAPVPDIPPIPGMDPGIFIAGGGAGGSGDDGDSGGAGGGGKGGDGKGGGKDAKGGGKGGKGCGAGAGGKCQNCGNTVAAGDPVDVVTGEVFTIPQTDLSLPGFIGLTLDRNYSVARRTEDVGLGWGWTHNFAWHFHVRGRTIHVKDSFGHSTTFPVLEPGTYSSAGGWALVRAGAGYLLRAGTPFQHFFAPDPKDATLYRLTSIHYGTRGTIFFGYEEGRLAQIIDTAGRRIRLAGDKDGRITSVSVASPTGRAIVFARYQYDHGGHLVAASDADGATWRYRYDDDRRLIEMRLPTDLSYHYRYDLKGRCVETWGAYPNGVDPSLAQGVPVLLADGITKAKGIHHAKLTFANGYTEFVHSVGVDRVFGGPGGKVTKGVNGAGGVTTRTLDKDGKEIARESANGAVTRWTYDAMGNVLSETDALGRTTRLVRDTQGEIIETVDAAGGKILTPRDYNGNVLSLTDQNGAVKTFRYTSRGQTAEEIDARGALTRYEYDSHGNLITRILANRDRVRFEYDYWGRCAREHMPDGRTLSFSYSDAGRMTRVQESLGRVITYEYDGLGYVTAVTPPDGQTTRFEYAGHGWLTNVVWANGDRREWRYNREGWLVSLTNEKGELHEWERDGAGRLVGERSFNGAVHKYTLDMMGFMTALEDESGVTTFERNVLGQILKRVAPDESETAMGYDVRGQLAAVSLGTVKVEFDRDPTGAVLRERHAFDGRTYEVASVRDPAALRTAVRTSLGLDLRMQRDAMGEVTELRDTQGVVVGFERAPNGRPLRRHLSKGGVIVDDYDGAARLVRRQVVPPNGRPIAGEQEPEWIGGAPPGTVYKAYGYSPIDEITSVTTAADGTTEFEYDVRRHVTKRRHAGSEERWTADAVANYYERDAEVTRTYLPGGRIAARGSTEYLWDDRGYLTEKRRTLVDGRIERWRYEWNGSNLLAAVELPDERRVDFDYDAYARRVAKRVSKATLGGGTNVLATTHYVWDGASLLHEVEIKGDEATPARTYLFEETDKATPIAQRDQAGDWIHYVGDVNGAPDELVDGAGKVVGGLRRSTFGAASPTPGSSVTTPFRAPGQIADDDIGLHYNRYRYYDPETGHYISPDPIGIDGGMNLYFFGPNPVAWYDLLGWQHQCTADVYGPPPDCAPLTIPQLGGGTPGNYQSGQRPAPDPPGTNNQSRTYDSEGQFARDCRAYQQQNGPNSLQGANASLNGQFPPCPTCHKAMRALADQTGMSVNYQWPGPPPACAPQSIQYNPNQPPAGAGAQAGALVGSGAPGDQGAYAATPTGDPANPYKYNAGGKYGDPNPNTAQGQYSAQMNDPAYGQADPNKPPGAANANPAIPSPTHDDGTPWQPPR
jgi:RHS repeat-associated protein